MKKILLLIGFSVIMVSINAQVSPLWFYDVSDMSFGNSACADIDKDGKLEILFSTYRNDSCLYALNAEDGSLLWKVNTGGCNDVAPLIYDVDMDGELEVVLPSSCVTKTFCFDAATGDLEWSANTRGSDSPPTVADVDNDGKPEILHGEFQGYVISLNGEDGSVNWEIAVDLNSWVQTAPAILDVDQNGQLDFVVATWVFGGNGDVYAYTADSAQLIWQDTIPGDYFYHGASFTDIDNDGKEELLMGCYDGYVYCLNAEDGSILWSYLHTGAIPQYVGAPTSIADFNKDGNYEVVFVAGNKVGLLSYTGSLLWDYTIPSYGSAFRGCAISDLDGDGTLDVVFGTSGGALIGLRGDDGYELFYEDVEASFGSNFEIDHGPIVADFDNDSINEIFLVGGHAEYPAIQNNYGRAYAYSTAMGSGIGWPMFRFDERRSGCLHDTIIYSNITERIVEDIEIHVSKVHGELSVLLNIYDDYEISLFDLSGKIIHKNTFKGYEYNFMINNLQKGVYLVHIANNNMLKTVKVLL